MTHRQNSSSRAARAARWVAAGLALAVASGSAWAQRMPTPNRIGESRFADQMREASESGQLNGGATPAPVTQYPTIRYPHKHYGHGYGYNPYVDDYWGYRRYDQYPYGIDGRVVRGGVSNVTYAAAQRVSQQAGSAQPAPQQAAPEPLSALDRARIALSSGEHSDSVVRYRAYLAEQRELGSEDFAVAVELAVALLAEGRHDDAVAMFRLAYSSDPGLAATPVNLRVGLSDARWRELVVSAVRHANRRGSPASWLAVGVLMQAEGRPDVALRMIDRASGLGLDDQIATPLAAALR